MLKQIFRTLLLLSLGAAVLGCTTRPVTPPREADPLAVLPPGDDFYLLARPSEHPVLSYEILRDLLPVDPSEIYPALERTDSSVISAGFGKPLAFSGVMEGRYPAFFVRRSLKKSPGWSRADEKTFKGPDDILADTIYKNTLLTASEEPRLDELQKAMMSQLPPDRAVLSPRDRQWWESGTPALLFYLPDLAGFPLPQGLPEVPPESSLLISLIPAEQGRYSLHGEFRFADTRSTRFWALGLRLFLAGRLGLSESPEERKAMGDLSIEVEGSTIILSRWTLSAPGWGHFISTFSTP